MSNTETKPFKYRWNNLASIRVILTAAFASLLLGLSASYWLGDDWGTRVATALMILLWLASGFNPPVNCTKCQAKMKLGAWKCSGCGEDYEPTRRVD